jgi:hypothetical protein
MLVLFRFVYANKADAEGGTGNIALIVPGQTARQHDRRVPFDRMNFPAALVATRAQKKT